MDPNTQTPNMNPDFQTTPNTTPDVPVAPAVISSPQTFSTASPTPQTNPPVSPDFQAAPAPTPRPKRSKKAALLGALIFVVAFVAVRLIFALVFNNTVDTNKLAAETKTKMGVPVKVDQYTTLTDITSGDKSIRYHYTISGLDTANLTNDSLKQSVASSVCANADTRKLINQNINMEYSYVVENSSTTYSFAVSKSDCK